MTFMTSADVANAKSLKAAADEAEQDYNHMLQHGWSDRERTSAFRRHLETAEAYRHFMDRWPGQSSND